MRGWKSQLRGIYMAYKNVLLRGRAHKRSGLSHEGVCGHVKILPLPRHIHSADDPGSKVVALGHGPKSPDAFD